MYRPRLGTFESAGSRAVPTKAKDLQSEASTDRNERHQRSSAPMHHGPIANGRSIAAALSIHH
jgi:hypothetical protein